MNKKIILIIVVIVALAAFFFKTRMHSTPTESGNWAMGGHDQEGTYYSPLMAINAENVDQLGFAWSYDMNTFRGQEATPLVVDGIMYTSGNWGHVYAVNAVTGKEIWHFDPKVPGQIGRNPCCDIVNRGVALRGDKVYVASLDGRLHALDAKTGQQIWDADTIIDHKLPYASTGAVTLTKDAVIIGNSGADMDEGGVRGYVSAYDLETGKFKWRFFTVPPPPGTPIDQPDLQAAEKTWPPHRPAKYLGGATVWDGVSYDPELDLLYFGTANAAPYDHRQMGPGDGDDLYVASIVALNAKTGGIAWHYQETPGDRWDFDAVAKLVMADLTLNVQSRKVLMQASKNGFFYILDRKTGELLSANNFAYVNWASHVDMKTGRPAITPQADYYSSPKNVYPSWAGAHSWNPMSYNLKTGLVYIPVVDVPSVWVDLAHNGGRLKFLNGYFTVNGIFPDDSYDAAALKGLNGKLPDMAELLKETGHPQVKVTRKFAREVLRAWDPVNSKVVWEQETSSGMRGYDGGVMSTASGLVFQGRGDGEFRVYSATDGKLLKSIQTGSHIMAAPMTYTVNGEQYVAVQAGYGGTQISVGPIPPKSAAISHVNMNRIIVFKLGGSQVPEPSARSEPLFPKPAKMPDPKLIAAGEVKFAEQCSRCHQFGPSVTPDLTRLPPGLRNVFKDIVLKGILSSNGMGKFDDLLSEQDVEAINAYLLNENWKGYNHQESIKQ
jgi:quinohemoprotein ethanol dehydrogenase